MQTITVNQVEISATLIAAEAQHHPAPTPNDAWNSAATALVVRELLLQEARRQGLEAEPEFDDKGRRLTDEDALIEALLAREVQTPEASEADCRRYYDNNPNRFTTPDIYEAAHILFSAAPEDKDGYDKALSKANDVLQTLKQDKTLFAQLARDLSACPSAEQGGNLGQVTKGQTVPEFETFLFSLDEGQICPVPVKTRFGIHIIRLDRKITGQVLPFEAVKEKIARYLEEASLRAATTQYVRILAGQADIAGVDLMGTDSPLVQ